jgi:PKD repeat protein
MKKLFTVLIVVALLLTSVACSRSSTTEEASYKGYNDSFSAVSGRGASNAPVVITTAPAPEITLTIPGSSTNYSADTDRMIVRTANLALVVSDIPGAVDQITNLAKTHGGYVVSSSSWRNNEVLQGSISIRVPAEDFDTVMRALGQLAVEVTSQTTSSKDVTEEYTDLSSKLKNLEAAEQQLIVIMAKATDVEDIIKVQAELTSIRENIEVTKGRMLYLERTSDTSLINISLEQSKLSVKFYANSNVVKAGEIVLFTVEVAGGFSPYSYNWDFGDGSTSTNQTPTHTYKSAKDYTVKLTVTDDRGNTDTETKTEYITVLPGWSAGNVARSAWQGLSAFGRVLVNILIWLGIFSPVWIIGGGIWFWLWRRHKKIAGK